MHGPINLRFTFDVFYRWLPPRFIYVTLFEKNFDSASNWNSPFHAVTQFVQALRYKSGGRRFDSQWCHLNSFHWHYPSSRTVALELTQPLKEMSTGNISRGIRCVKLTTLPPSYADCLEMWELQPPGTLRACPGLYRDCFTFTFTFTLFYLPKFYASPCTMGTCSLSPGWTLGVVHYPNLAPMLRVGVTRV